jgi:glutathione S-transferase
MKLYYSPGACSLSPHIVLCETEQHADLVRVDLKAHKTADGRDYHAVNAKGYVPALELDDGQVLTEGPAIVQYLADKAPATKLAPPAGTLERYRVQEWLNFIGTEIHKSFSPLFNPANPDAMKQAASDKLTTRFTWLEKQLASGGHLIGAFSVADAYLYTVLRWTVPLKMDMEPYPNIRAYMDRVSARPKVRKALQEEGLA